MAAVTAVQLSLASRRYGGSTHARLGLPAAAVAAVALVFVPLSFGIYNLSCNDTGSQAYFELNPVVIAGFVAWAVILLSLYRAAGEAWWTAVWTWLAVLLLTVLAVPVELFISVAGLEGYCNNLGNQ